MSYKSPGNACQPTVGTTTIIILYGSVVYWSTIHTNQS